MQRQNNHLYESGAIFGMRTILNVRNLITSKFLWHTIHVIPIHNLNNLWHTRPYENSIKHSTQRCKLTKQNIKHMITYTARSTETDKSNRNTNNAHQQKCSNNLKNKHNQKDEKSMKYQFYINCSFERDWPMREWGRDYRQGGTVAGTGTKLQGRPEKKKNENIIIVQIGNVGLIH